MGGISTVSSEQIDKTENSIEFGNYTQRDEGSIAIDEGTVGQVQCFKSTQSAFAWERQVVKY